MHPLAGYCWVVGAKRESERTPPSLVAAMKRNPLMFALSVLGACIIKAGVSGREWMCAMDARAVRLFALEESALRKAGAASEVDEANLRCARRGGLHPAEPSDRLTSFCLQCFITVVVGKLLASRGSVGAGWPG